MNSSRVWGAAVLATGIALAAVRWMPCESAFAASTFPDPTFWKSWTDGQAELAGYELTFSRYGELRQGTAVTIFVTETFSNEARVKADPGVHASSDEFPVMKLNLVQDFPTGLYDYNLMTSAFVALQEVNGAPIGSPTKVSFSSQEWCGHAYQQLLFDQASIRATSHSYFDREGDQSRTIPQKTGGFAEETLLLWARGFAAPFLAAGESKTVPFLPGAEWSRLKHKPIEWTEASLSRSKTSTSVTVPAGTFSCETYRAVIEGNREWTIDVELAPPHRIVRWATNDGGRAELLAAERMKYWEMNANKFDEEVKRLGLQRRTKRTM